MEKVKPQAGCIFPGHEPSAHGVVRLWCQSLGKKNRLSPLTWCGSKAPCPQTSLASPGRVARPGPESDSPDTPWSSTWREDGPKTGLRGCMEEGKCGGAKHRAPPTIDQTVVSPTQTRSGWAYKIQTTPPVGALEVRDLQEKTGRFYVKCTPGRVRLSWARARRAWRGPALVPKNLSKID